MERQHLFHVCNSCFFLKKIKNPNKRKECECQQAGGEEFARSQPLFSERPFLIKRPKPSSSGTGSIVVASRNPGRVLRELNLFDENWVLENSAASDSSNQESAEELERRVAFNLRTMRSSYTLEDMMEERSRGVSTEISLYHHDPFKIKKKMKPSDLGNLCRLLVSADLVEKHILPFLNEDQTKQVEIPNQERNGLKVWVRDILTLQACISWSSKDGALLRAIFSMMAGQSSSSEGGAWLKEMKSDSTGTVICQYFTSVFCVELLLPAKTKILY